MNPVIVPAEVEVETKSVNEELSEFTLVYIPAKDKKIHRQSIKFLQCADPRFDEVCILTSTHTINCMTICMIKSLYCIQN